MNTNKSNLIILTPGLSGSSVLTALLSKSGYFLGDNTAKIQYDTFENQKLVEHNISLLRQTGYQRDDPGDIPPPSVEKIRALHNNIDIAPYIDFIKECEKSSPWIWKDPRLSYTMFFWKELLTMNDCNFILITREMDQIWTGLILRARLPVSLKNLRKVQGNAISSARQFLNAYSINALELNFEGLLLYPENTLDLLNSFLGLNISRKELSSVYTGKLNRKRWSWHQKALACLYFMLYKAMGKEVRIPRPLRSN